MSVLPLEASPYGLQAPSDEKDVSGGGSNGKTAHSASQLAVALPGLRLVIEDRIASDGRPCGNTFIVRCPPDRRAQVMRLFAALEAMAAATGWTGGEA